MLAPVVDTMELILRAALVVPGVATRAVYEGALIGAAEGDSGTAAESRNLLVEPFCGPRATMVPETSYMI